MTAQEREQVVRTAIDSIAQRAYDLQDVFAIGGNLIVSETGEILDFLPIRTAAGGFVRIDEYFGDDIWGPSTKYIPDREKFERRWPQFYGKRDKNGKIIAVQNQKRSEDDTCTTMSEDPRYSESDTRKKSSFWRNIIDPIIRFWNSED